MAIDYGDARTGVAVSDPTGFLAGFTTVIQSHNADFVAAELALAGIESAIPADEVIWAMKKVGDPMPTALKETAEGGLAATPTGRRIAEELLGP